MCNVTIQHPSFRYHDGTIFALDDDSNDAFLSFGFDAARVFARELADFAANVGPNS
jgi:hypothetical protein